MRKLIGNGASSRFSLLPIANFRLQRSVGLLQFGGALLHAIMIEKWIALFQNIESYSDYRRTCVPNLAPAGGADAIPARVLYAFTERNTNPNVPPPAEQPLRNDNDPVTATTPTGAACLGQS